MQNSARLHLRLPPALLDQVRTVAAASGLTLSAWIRLVVTIAATDPPD